MQTPKFRESSHCRCPRSFTLTNGSGEFTVSSIALQRTIGVKLLPSDSSVRLFPKAFILCPGDMQVIAVSADTDTHIAVRVKSCLLDDHDEDITTLAARLIGSDIRDRGLARQHLGQIMTQETSSLVVLGEPGSPEQAPATAPISQTSVTAPTVPEPDSALLEQRNELLKSLEVETEQLRVAMDRLKELENVEPQKEPEKIFLTVTHMRFLCASAFMAFALGRCINALLRARA